jgi:hypothetical protein
LTDEPIEEQKDRLRDKPDAFRHIDEPRRMNMRRSANEDQEVGAPPSQDLARPPPLSF